MRKGFLHVVEALIVILLVFVVLSQFYSIPRSTYPWAETKLRIMAQDLVYVLDEKLTNDDDWFDPVAVAAAVSGSVPETMGFSLKTTQAVKPVMTVGVVVSNAVEYNEIVNNVLMNTTINGVVRGFHTDMLYHNDFHTFPGDYDVLLFYGDPGITTAQEDYLQEHLRGGNGVVQYDGLTQTQVDEPWHQALFDLEWSTSTRPGDTDAEFQISTPPERSYDVMKLYNTVNGYTDFVNYGTENVYPVGVNAESRIVLRQRSSYTGGSHAGRSVPIAVINWDVHGNGRTAWMSDGSLFSASNRNEDTLRSLVMWTASKTHYTVKDDIMVQSASASFRKIFTTDMYEPVNIELTLGYHF
jgi:hypothetical protein